MNLTGKVRETTRSRRSGLYHLEIRLEQLKLPNIRLPIMLVVGKRRFATYLHCSEGTPTPWISQKLIDDKNERTTLAAVLRQAGIEKNQKVRLKVSVALTPDRS